MSAAIAEPAATGFSFSGLFGGGSSKKKPAAQKPPRPPKAPKASKAAADADEALGVTPVIAKKKKQQPAAAASAAVKPRRAAPAKTEFTLSSFNTVLRSIEGKSGIARCRKQLVLPMLQADLDALFVAASVEIARRVTADGRTIVTLDDVLAVMAGHGVTYVPPAEPEAQEEEDGAGADGDASETE